MTAASRSPSVHRHTSSRRIVVVVLPPVDELDLIGPLQVFNSVNRLAGRTIYTIEVATNAKDLTIAGEHRAFFDEIEPTRYGHRANGF